MNRSATVLMLATLLTVPMVRAVRAQGTSDREKVRLAAMDYLEGFYQGDTTRLVRSISRKVQKFGYYLPRGSDKYAFEAMPWEEILSYAEGVKSGKYKTPANAIKKVEVYDVLDQTASAKVTAWWGSDYLLLTLEDGRWKIIQILWQSPVPAKTGEP